MAGKPVAIFATVMMVIEMVSAGNRTIVESFVFCDQNIRPLTFMDGSVRILHALAFSISK